MPVVPLALGRWTNGENLKFRGLTLTPERLGSPLPGEWGGGGQLFTRPLFPFNVLSSLFLLAASSDGNEHVSRI